jgi:hypothetical protein
MHIASHLEESEALARIRGFLLATLAVGLAGTLAELVLLGHDESAQQWIPIVLLACGMLVVAWHAAAPRPITVRALQTTMVVFLATALLGIGLHYDGNVEFELEITPSMGGFELVKEALTGATPVMAPGAMGLLGLIGLAHTYRHPILIPRDSTLHSGR